LTNLNDHDVLVSGLLGSYVSLRTVYAIDDRGRPIGLSDSVRNPPHGGTNGIFTRDELVLPPGCAIAEPVALTDYLAFPGEGKYTVLLKADGLKFFGHVVSRPITVEICGRPKLMQNVGGLHDGHAGVGLEGATSTRGNPTASAVLRHVYHEDLEVVLSPIDHTHANLAVTVKRLPADEFRKLFEWARERPPAPAFPRPGARASDYRLTVREQSGKNVPMNEWGKNWVATHRVEPQHVEWRSLRYETFFPGFSVGFVFPLDKMYSLLPGDEYVAEVAISNNPGGAGLRAGPVRFRAPRRICPGLNRPLFGSERFWDRLAPMAGKTQGGVELTSVVDLSPMPSSQARELGWRETAQSAFPELHFGLWNHGNRCLDVCDLHPSLPIRGSHTLLLYDQSGDIVPANENRKSVRTEGQLDDDLPAGEDGISKRIRRYPLGLIFPLRPGGRYTALLAIEVGGDVDSLLVAKPVTFTVPTDQKGADAVLGWQKPAAVRPTFDEPWQTHSRFAGKAFEGLQLNVAMLRDPAVPAKMPRLSVTLRNCSDAPIVVKKWKGDSDYQILVRDPAGKLLPPNEKGKKFFDSSTRLDVRELQPDRSIEASLPIFELFDFKTSGKYTVLVSLPVLGDVDAVLTAAPLQIRIP
jgi:hypothetical protein